MSPAAQRKVRRTVEFANINDTMRTAKDGE